MSAGHRKAGKCAIFKKDIFTHIISPGQMVKTIPVTVPQVWVAMTAPPSQNLRDVVSMLNRPAGSCKVRKFFIPTCGTLFRWITQIAVRCSRLATAGVGFLVEMSCLLDTAKHENVVFSRKSLILKTL